MTDNVSYPWKIRVAESHGRGRPFLVAVIPYNQVNDVVLALLQEFFTAVKGLNYRECMALSRAFKISPAAVDNWRYGRNAPKYDKMLSVIQWVKEGKPTEKRYQPGALWKSRSMFG